jgi:hypothetical protein
MLLNLKGVPADGLPGPLRGGGGGRPPVLFLAVPVFDFLAGVGGSEESVPGAFRFPELEAFCAVCAISVRFGCSDFYGIVLDSSCAVAQIRGRKQKETTRKTQFNLCVQIRKS